jgi:hypothetical protein
MNVVSYCRGATLRRSLRAGGDHRRGRSGRSGIRPSTQRDACPFDTEQAEDFGLQRGFVAQSLDAGKVQDHVVAGSTGGGRRRGVCTHRYSRIWSYFRRRRYVRPRRCNLYADRSPMTGAGQVRFRILGRCRSRTAPDLADQSPPADVPLSRMTPAWDSVRAGRPTGRPRRVPGTVAPRGPRRPRRSSPRRDG